MKDFKELPDQERMEEAAELDIFDIEGNKIKFGALFKEQKTIVVFISERNIVKQWNQTNIPTKDTFFVGSGLYSLYKWD